MCIHGIWFSYLLRSTDAKNGASKEEIIDGIHWHCEHMEQIFTVSTLEYLLKGGRLSKASAIAGGLLDIKPIIQVNEWSLGIHREGERKAKSLKRLIEMVGERGKGSSLKPLELSMETMQRPWRQSKNS